LPEPQRRQAERRIEKIARTYDELSEIYQASKAGNDIPLN
jgi:hypothetical protein